jgi:hypothetical protein
LKTRAELNGKLAIEAIHATPRRHRRPTFLIAIKPLEGGIV